MSRDDMSRVVYASFSRGMEAPTFTDFEEGIRALCIDFSQETVRHLFERGDRNNDGRLSSHEFRQLSDVYPKFVECLYHRLKDRRLRDIQEEAIHQAGQQAESVMTKRDAMVSQLENASQRLRDSENELVEETKRLEEERQREANARAKDDAERVDQVSSRQADQVASALDKQAKGVCAEKKEQFYSTLSEDNIRAFGEKLAKEWRRKEGDVVDELIENLKVPDSVHSKLAVVAEAARHLHQTKSEAYPNKNRAELLVMTMYTMAGPDIDALVTYENVPVYDEEDKAPWEQYTQQYSKERNGAIFSAINWAMRTAADPAKAEEKDGKEAWATCSKWIKYIGLLLSVCTQVDPQHSESGAELARGLAGLPAEVFEAHRGMLPNDSLCWPSASSCAFDRSVSESYIRGDAANATKTSGGSILFLLAGVKHGVSLQQISKYPKESEMLVPPFSTFKVGYQDIDQSLPGTCVMNMSSEGHIAPESWLMDLATASHHSSQRLQTALVTHAEAALRERQTELERQKQRERNSNSDLVKTEREVDRQKNRLVMSQQDIKRAEDRLRELEKLLQEQHTEVAKQREIVERNTQELRDSESMREAALYDKELTQRSVQSAEDTVKEAEDTLDGVKKAKEQRRIESQVQLNNAKKDASTREKARDDADAKVARDKTALQQAKLDLEAANGELSECDRKMMALREEANEAMKKRRSLDEEEAPILELEIKLVMQRLALEEKEAKHYHDLRSFDEQWRPASPKAIEPSPAQMITSQPLAHSTDMQSVHRSLTEGNSLASPLPFKSQDPNNAMTSYQPSQERMGSQPSQTELPPPKQAASDDLQTKLDRSDEDVKQKEMRIRELERRLRGSEQQEGAHLSPMRPSRAIEPPVVHEPPKINETQRQPMSASLVAVGRPQVRPNSPMSAVEQIRLKMLSKDLSRQKPAAAPVAAVEARPAPSHTLSEARPAEREVHSRDTPAMHPTSGQERQSVDGRSSFYLPQSAIEHARNREAGREIAPEPKRDEIRVGRPAVGRPPAPMGQVTTGTRDYIASGANASIGSRGISPALVPSKAPSAVREDTGASLERRIARLSAEVAASRERASHPRSGR
eukprot:TRINITY_DN1554_c0_g1_i4.p1 TRINITY_DN1554_c0_g1~~TRINITY_DN1554_c0_g1_i4.p1  ORF type:complete len:1096 (+),score=227.16 TRINITY_DN1554_c0_g1_i4:44-3331(+)